MLKKASIGVLVLVIVLSAGLYIWARTALGGDAVRTALATQLSARLGQPVTIGSVNAALYPRLTVNLGDVDIGQPPRITVQTLHVGTDVRALLSRRIERARMNLSGARIELPLPDFAFASAGGAPAGNSAPSAPPVEIVSIDEVVFRDVQIVSHGRTLHGDIEVVPRGQGLDVRRIAIGADKAKIEITGQIADLAGPSGELSITAGALNFDDLMAFVSDFSSGAGLPSTAPAADRPSTMPSSTSTMNLAVALKADRATFGALTIEGVSGKARLTPAALTLEPVSFGLFSGKYEGSLALSLAASPEFELKAKVSGIDVAAVTAFAGNPNTITGRLSGQLDLNGRGLEAPAVMRTARGSLRADITDGTIKNLGLIETVVIATSGRADAKSPSGSRDEPFSRLGATLTVSGGSASTRDLRLESKDLLLSAAGAFRLDGNAINLRGQVQLSDELSQQAGRDLVRYTQQQGRVTLPATITGSASSPQVSIDVADLARRAVTNRAMEEAQKTLKKGLEGLFPKRE